jgi:hypothetical protein
MKLGRDTGSVSNWLMSGSNGQPRPEVGMGVTLLHWTDRSAGTITRVSPSGKTFWFKVDRAIRTDTNGMSESQQYRFEPDPAAPEQVARLTKNGGYKTTGGPRLRLGQRSAYHDFSF